jgi:hypothetical protein
MEHGLEAHEERMEHGRSNISYLTDWEDDVTKRIQRGRQGTDRKSSPRLDSAPVSRLLLVVKDEERRLGILPLGPPDPRASPRVRLTTYQN